MTNVSTDHPNHIPYIELTEEGRKISFRRDCFGEIEILRKVNDQNWELLVKEVRTPYIDEEKFPPGTKLTYSIRLEEDKKKKKFSLDVRL